MTVVPTPPCQSGWGSPITPFSGAKVGKPLLFKNVDPSSFLENFVPQKTPRWYPSTALPETAERPPSLIDSTPLRSRTLFL